MSKKAQLLLADDHALFCESFAFYLNRRADNMALHLAADLDDALDLLAEDHASYELVLLDLQMPGMRGLAGLERVRAAFPELRVALLSGTAEPADVQAAMKLGAVGYFPKTLPAQTLLAGIRQVLGGETYFPCDPGTGRLIVSYRANAYPQARAILTPREHQVLGLLANGMSNKLIAARLGLQVVTVKLHVRGVCRKLGAANRTQAALLAKQFA